MTPDYDVIAGSKCLCSKGGNPNSDNHTLDEYIARTSAVFKISLAILFSLDIFQCHPILKIFSTSLSTPPSLVVLLRCRHYIHQGPPSPSMDNAATELSFSVLPIAGETEQEREGEGVRGECARRERKSILYLMTCQEMKH